MLSLGVWHTLGVNVLLCIWGSVNILVASFWNVNCVRLFGWRGVVLLASKEVCSASQWKGEGLIVVFLGLYFWGWRQKWATIDMAIFCCYSKGWRRRGLLNLMVRAKKTEGDFVWRKEKLGRAPGGRRGWGPRGKWGPFVGCGPRALVALGGKGGKAETEFPEVLPGRGTRVQGA